MVCCTKYSKFATSEKLLDYLLTFWLLINTFAVSLYKTWPLRGIFQLWVSYHGGSNTLEYLLVYLDEG